MNKTTEYLKKMEWSMGNGQCPECCGVPASWHGHPCHMTTENIGHEADCSLAAALRDAGEAPLMKGDFTSNMEFEHYITESGFFGTRPKTEEGCPRYRAYAEKIQRDFDSAMLSAMSERPNVKYTPMPVYIL